MATAVIGAVGAIGGAFIASKGSKDAAQTQASAINKASGISATAAAQARRDAFDLFNPALEDFVKGIELSIDALSAGRITTADILQQSTANADQLLSQGSIAAQRAVLGLPPIEQPPLGSIEAQRQVEQLQQGVPPAEVGAAPGVPEEIRRPGIIPSPAAPPGLPVTPTEEMLAPDLGEEELFERFKDTEGIPRGPGIARQQLQQAAITQSVFDQAPLAPGARPIEPPIQMQQQPGGFFAPGPPMEQLTPQAPTGLAGAESALAQAASGAGAAAGLGTQLAREDIGAGLADLVRAERLGVGELAQGFGQGRTDIAGGLALGRQAIGQGIGALQGAETRGLGQLQQGFGRAQQAIGAAGRGVTQAIGQGIGELRGGEQRGLAQIAAGTGRAVGELEQFAGVGESALQREAAMSGALGPEAQAEAFRTFQESPGQKFLRERQEQALLRTAAARGGLGGGRVQTALQEQAAGIAAQQEQRFIENLRSLSSQGLLAAGQQGGFQQQRGLAGGELVGRLAGQAGALRGTQAGITGQLGGQLAGIAGQLGAAGAGLVGQLGGAQAGLFGQQAGIEQGGAQNLANLAAQKGLTTSQLISQLTGARAGLGTQLGGVAERGGLTQAQILQNLGGAQAGLRTGAGQNLAGIISGTAGQRAQGQLGLGAQLGGLEQTTTANIANLISQGGAGQTGLRTQLAALLGNIATGQGTQQATLVTQAGSAQAAGTLGQAAAIQQGLSGVAKSGILEEFLRQIGR